MQTQSGSSALPFSDSDALNGEEHMLVRSFLGFVSEFGGGGAFRRSACSRSCLSASRIALALDRIISFVSLRKSCPGAPKGLFTSSKEFPGPAGKFEEQ